MNIGLIGCGNMARAMARGWGRPVLCFDPMAERAQALAQETGGEALDSNAEVAARADLIVLCHKPAQLGRGHGEHAAARQRLHPGRRLLQGNGGVGGGADAPGSHDQGQAHHRVDAGERDPDAGLTVAVFAQRRVVADLEAPPR